MAFDYGTISFDGIRRLYFYWSQKTPLKVRIQWGIRRGPRSRTDIIEVLEVLEVIHDVTDPKVMMAGANLSRDDQTEFLHANDVKDAAE